jgi:peptide/nickel transport system permease protein
MTRWKSYFSHWRNWLSLALLAILAGMALAAPRLAPQENPNNPQTLQQVGRGTDSLPHPPSPQALLGTLSGQYDVWFTLIWGLRQAFQFGLIVTIITAIFGILYGGISAYFGGIVNNFMMRITDAFMAIPIIAIIVFIRQIIVILLNNLGAFFAAYQGNYWYPQGANQTLQEFLIKIDPVMWSLILFSWMPYARLINASVLRLRKVEFITSARALGAGHLRILLRHMLPNAISPEIVLAARDVGGMVILQATFTFIGLGGYSPWGDLLSRARNWVVGPGGNPLVYWWTYVPATLLLILFSASWNFLGDSLNERLNPRRVG